MRLGGHLCHPSAHQGEQQHPRDHSACSLPARAGTDQALLHGCCSHLGLKSWVPSRACSPPTQLYTSHFPEKGAGVADFYQTQTTGSPQGPSSPVGTFPASLPPAWHCRAPRHVPSSQRRTFTCCFFLSPVPGCSPSTQHQCFCCLPWAALAPTVVGPQVTQTLGSWGPGVCRVHVPGHLLLTSTPRLTQPFARAPSPSCSPTQTSHSHRGGLEPTAEPSQAPPAAGPAL